MDESAAVTLNVGEMRVARKPRVMPSGPPIPAGPDEDLVVEITRIMNRGPNRDAWPQDERDLWDKEAMENSYTHADVMLRRHKARKIIALVRG